MAKSTAEAPAAEVKPETPPETPAEATPPAPEPAPAPVQPTLGPTTLSSRITSFVPPGGLTSSSKPPQPPVEETPKVPMRKRVAVAQGALLTLSKGEELTKEFAERHHITDADMDRLLHAGAIVVEEVPAE